MKDLGSPATILNASRLTDQAITEFLQAAEAGNAPVRSEFIQQHAGVRSALESFFDAYDQMGPNRPEQENAHAAFTSGGHVGRHRLVRSIGSGAFGTVWLGFDSQLKRPVAIKVPNPERFSSQKQRDLFLSEAQTVAQLEHPNIVPIYDVGETESGDIYLVSRYIAGNNLATEMQGRRFSFSEAAQCVKHIADALMYAHDRRLIHRDIKPSNILIDAVSGQPYVTDFGLAQNADAAEDSPVAGTPAYMSPEQALGDTLDHRSDVFSLGVVFYELLCGKRPFNGTTAAGIMKSVCEDVPSTPSQIDDAIPDALEETCLRSLAKPLDQRLGSMAEFQSELAAYLNSISDTSIDSMSVESSTRNNAPRKLSSRIVPAIAILAATAGLTFAVNWFQSDNTTMTPVERKGTASESEKSIDRQIAEETIRLGGHIDFRYEGDDYEVDSIDAIPDGDISLLWVMFADEQTLTDDYLSRLRLLDSMEGVDLCRCHFSDSGFAHLGDIKTLKMVHAPNTQVDTGVKALAALPRLNKLTLTSTDVSNETLRPFKGNTSIKFVRLSDTRVTDEGLRFIGTIENLESLNVNDCRITDIGIKHLSDLAKLEVADFGQTEITDKSLEYLESCPLKQLVVPPGVSKSAVETFQKKHPSCVVERD